MPPLDAEVIREAARWLVRLHSGEAGPQDHAAFERWRRASPERELAWQRAQRLSQQFSAVPAALGVPLLTRPGRSKRRAMMGGLLALGVALPAAWLGYRQTALPEGVEDYRTAVGESRRLVLDDGSQLHLNTDTGVDVAFSPSARRLQLRSGEIYVQTASDHAGVARPFLIDTAQGRLRALGTRFVVRRLYDGQAMTALSVLEHRVEVTPRNGAAPRIIEAGQTVRFSANGFESSAPAGRPVQQAHDAPAWTRGLIEVHNWRLDTLLAELSRYRPGVLRCDPSVASLRVSGVFRLDDTDAVVATVAETLSLEVSRRTRYWVTLNRREA